jgi:hypothetical protein
MNTNAKDTVRIVRDGDEKLVEELAGSLNLVPPALTQMSLVAITPEGKARGVAVIRNQVTLEIIGEDSKSGHISRVRLFKAAENFMKAHGVNIYLIGVSPNAESMLEIVEKMGFQNMGELLFARALDDVLG